MFIILKTERNENFPLVQANLKSSFCFIINYLKSNILLLFIISSLFCVFFSKNKLIKFFYNNFFLITYKIFIILKI